MNNNDNTPVEIKAHIQQSMSSCAWKKVKAVGLVEFVVVMVTLHQQMALYYGFT